MLFDIRRLAWDAQLPDAFGIPNSMLPEVLETASFPPDRENTGKHAISRCSKRGWCRQGFVIAVMTCQIP